MWRIRAKRSTATWEELVGHAAHYPTEYSTVRNAKRTSELIPLCHPLALTKIEIQLELSAVEPRVLIEALVETESRWEAVEEQRVWGCD